MIRSLPLVTTLGLLLIGAIGSSWAAKPERMSERLTLIRGQVLGLEQDLIDGVKVQKEAQASIKKIKELLKLQKEERRLGRMRLIELESTIGELETRRAVLRDKVLSQKRAVGRSLREIHLTLDEQPRTIRGLEREKVEAVRQRVLANLVDRGLKEIEVIRIDLADADQLEQKIQEEKGHLAYLFNDLKEQESVLELNQQLQADLIKKKHHERLTQLENYRKLKSSETQVERLLRDFNSRVELEKVVENERQASRALSSSAFFGRKGKLEFPLRGKVVAQFGKNFDPESNLFVFKKGIDIEAPKGEIVKAVSGGKVAYSGELPGYGRVVILDHGDHFYSLCAHLGELRKKAGESVNAGESVGSVDNAGTPVYFEIRARNVALNPLQWVSN